MKFSNFTGHQNWSSDFVDGTNCYWSGDCITNAPTCHTLSSCAVVTEAELNGLFLVIIYTLRKAQGWTHQPSALADVLLYILRHSQPRLFIETKLLVCVWQGVNTALMLCIGDFNMRV